MRSPSTGLRALVRPIGLDEPVAGTLAARGVLGTVGVAVQGGLRFLTSTLVGRFGGPAVLGVVQSAISVAMFLALLWPTTTGSAASKFVARARGAGDTHEVQAVAAHLGKRTLQATLLLAVIALPVWVLANGGTWTGGLNVAALVIGYSGYSFTRGLLYGIGQVHRATVWDVVSACTGLAAILVLLVSGVRSTVLLLPLAGAYAAYTVVSWPYGARGRPAPALRREIDVFVALGVSGTIASTGFLQLSMVVARLVGGDQDAGQYAAALTLATPASLLAGSLSLVLFPTMAETLGRGEHEQFRRQTDQSTRLLVVVMVAVFGALALCSRLGVQIIWGPRFAEAANLLPVLLLAVMVTTLAVASVNALITHSQRGMVITTISSLGGMLVGIAVWAVIARDMGVLGVAIGYLCGTAVIAGVPLAVVWRQQAQHWTALMVRLALGVVGLLALLGVQRAFGTSPWLDPAFSLVFLAGWLVLCLRDTRMVLALFARRR